MEKNIMVQILVAANSSLLHTQLWIDPAEEFVQYALDNSNPIYVTFAVKELKAFLHFFRDVKWTFIYTLRRPILMAPLFGIDEGASSNYDSTFVLATMLTTQLNECNTGPSANGMSGQADNGEASGEQPEMNRTSASEFSSNHKRIWSELWGSAGRSGSGSDGRQVPEERILKAVVSQELKGLAPFKYQKLHQLKERSKLMDMIFHRLIKVIRLMPTRMRMMVTRRVMKSAFDQLNHTMKIDIIMFPV